MSPLSSLNERAPSSTRSPEGGCSPRQVGNYLNAEVGNYLNAVASS
jgi:hypothetical protein